MIVKLNAIEVASTLAHQALYDEQRDIIANEDDLYDGENYKDEHQDVFNRHYDYFLDILTKEAIEIEKEFVVPNPPYWCKNNNELYYLNLDGVVTSCRWWDALNEGMIVRTSLKADDLKTFEPIEKEEFDIVWERCIRYYL